MSTAEVLTLTNEQYHGDHSAVSNSAKEVFRRDRLAYYCQYVTGSMPKPEQTESQALGEFVHMSLLEPERFVNEIVVPVYGSSSVPASTLQSSLTVTSTRSRCKIILRISHPAFISQPSPNCVRL